MIFLGTDIDRRGWQPLAPEQVFSSQTWRQQLGKSADESTSSAANAPAQTKFWRDQAVRAMTRICHGHEVK